MSRLFRFGKNGYDLYDEIHQNYVNKAIHAVFMQGVVLSVFCMARLIDRRCAMISYLLYFNYYLLFDPLGAVFCVFYYLPAFRLSYRLKKVKYPFLSSLGIMVACLLIQEVYGHLMFENQTSDLNQVLNSITIAPLYASNSFLEVVSYIINE